MPHNNLNPVETAVALLLLVFSPDLARVVGPYAVIILASGTGAAWSLGRRDKTAQGSAIWYFFKMIVTACLMTVGIASIIQDIFKLSTDMSWLLAPVGLLVGAVGDDWPAVGRWIVNRIGRLIDRKYGTEGGDDAQR